MLSLIENVDVVIYDSALWTRNGRNTKVGDTSPGRKVSGFVIQAPKAYHFSSQPFRAMKSLTGSRVD